MNESEIRWLTWGAIAHRPHGAAKWDEPGTLKAITECCGTWELPTATEHVLAHARDPKARTPFAIKGTPPTAQQGRTPRFPPKVHEECRRHPGEWPDNCRACAADTKAGEPPRTVRHQRTSDYATHIAQLRAIARGDQP